MADGSETYLCIGTAGDSCDNRRQCEIRVIEYVEELSLDAQGNVLGERHFLGQVKIAPGEPRAAQGVASQVAELAVGR